MDYDVVIIGGGPSGLATAIKLAQTFKEKNLEKSICLLEKSAEIGGHILSGNVFETTALDELIPDWKEKGAPLDVKVKRDAIKFLINDKYSYQYHLLLCQQCRTMVIIFLAWATYVDGLQNKQKP